MNHRVYVPASLQLDKNWVRGFRFVPGYTDLRLPDLSLHIVITSHSMNGHIHKHSQHVPGYSMDSKHSRHME